MKFENEQLIEKIHDVKAGQTSFHGAIKLLNDAIKACKVEIGNIAKLDPNAEINKIQKKIIFDAIQEALTPVKRNMAVDFKQIRKVLEECVRNVKDDQKKITLNRKDLEAVQK